MSLIPVARDKFTLGQALPWAVYDQERNVLMAQGEVIANDEQLQALMARTPLRELSWNAGTTEPGANREEPAEKILNAALAAPTESSFSFMDMRVRVGDRIQLQPPITVGPERYIVRLIGYLENVSMLVTAPLSNGLRVQIREGDKIVARVFTSQKAFAFDCKVERVCKIPYDYLHLSFPQVVQGAIIRKSPRIKTRIIASIAKQDAADSKERLSGVIVNISADGALLKARDPIYEKSQLITLSFRVNLHNVDAYLTTKAIIRNIFSEDGKDKDEPLKYHHGIQFLDLQPNDSVILQSLIYQQMIEQPNTLV